MPDFALTIDRRSRMILHRPGEPDVEDVSLRRAFPWSMPDRWISNGNAEGKEVMRLEDLARLDAQQREIIERAMERTIFIPRILRVHHVQLLFGFMTWRVETDRGPITFRVQEREDL